MAEAFFRVFDEDKSGALSFYEYMLVKTAPKLESQEDRLGWIFHAFDSDGGGSIDNTEVPFNTFIFISPVCLQIYKLVEALYRMSGQVDDKDAEEKIADCVRVSQIFYLSPFT